eukprot:251579-Pelagomonas_calceolata.AAC.1
MADGADVLVESKFLTTGLPCSHVSLAMPVAEACASVLPRETGPYICLNNNVTLAHCNLKPVVQEQRERARDTCFINDNSCSLCWTLTALRTQHRWQQSALALTVPTNYEGEISTTAKRVCKQNCVYGTETALHQEREGDTLAWECREPPSPERLQRRMLVGIWKGTNHGPQRKGKGYIVVTVPACREQLS